MNGIDSSKESAGGWLVRIAMGLSIAFCLQSGLWAQSDGAAENTATSNAESVFAQHPLDFSEVSQGEYTELKSPEDSAIAIADLEKQLTTIYDMATLLEAVQDWTELVKQRQESIVNNEAGLSAQQKTDLQDGRKRLIDRANKVIEVAEARGIEVPAETKGYLGSFGGGLDLDVSGTDQFLESVIAWAKSPEGGLRWAKNLVFFILTLIAFSILARIASKLVGAALNKMTKASQLVKEFLANTARNIVRIVGLIMALSMLEVPVGPFVAAIGAVGFILGFALQGTLNNFAAGLMLLIYRPYDVGNYVTIAGVSGTVNAMSLVSTTLRTPDNQTIVVPNGSIWGDVIQNTTGLETRRVDLVFGIGYGDDIAKAMSVMEDVCKSHPSVLEDPALNIQVNELADSSVNFICRPWCRTEDYWAVKWDLTRTVKERFDAEGISIPFPQRDVHLFQENAS